MGQCMSRKAAGAFVASAAAAHHKPKMRKHHQLESPGEEDQNRHHLAPSRPNPHSKGVSTSFGFKRRPTTAPSISSNSNAARRLAHPDALIDRNGNGHEDTESLTGGAAPIGRSTPRLMPPKKEANATRLNRFGFRQPPASRLHKLSDLNQESHNNNQPKGRNDYNKNRIPKPHQPERFMLQLNQLPEPVTKTAKTLANNSRRCASVNHEDNLSKDGSLTEDSGVGSQTSGNNVDRLNSSPTYGARRSHHKSRNLEIVMSGNTFDVRDLEDVSENCAPLPQLPSAFSTPSTHVRGYYQNSGFVRERAMEYQRHLNSDNRRKISVTSSEGFSDEEKTSRDKYKSEKGFMKPSAKCFLKTRPKDDSSPPSSDEHEWIHGGEAMADESSFSVSSSDESRAKDQPLQNSDVDNITTALETLMTASINNTFNKPMIKNALLTIEDPKFAAVVSSCGGLLDDETSPVDSLLSGSESEELVKRKLARSSSNSKDINEKLTPPSPGTPTNASNSLSLSDTKDDFLIDDEIADQPALVFEDTLTLANNESFSVSLNSEGTTTVVDSTPKPKRRMLLAIEGSPLSLRKKKMFHSRAGSLDTLSPCESIASDDMMMDFDYSQSSGLDDLERNDSQSHGFSSLDDTVLRRAEIGVGGGVLRDWSTLLGTCTSDKNLRSNPSKTSRLLWSRTGTPNSIPDSPKSLDGKSSSMRSRHSICNSPLRLSRPSLLSTGYDSDDSIRLDRANHTAMKQDVMSIKTMLLKLRRTLNELPDEDIMLKSDIHIPFDGQLTLTNGLFNGLSEDAQGSGEDNRLELAELRTQVLFLQGQLEDKEKAVQTLQDQMVRLATDTYQSNSAPASTISECNTTCNAATQTERVRPISAGPALFNGSSPESNGSLVSASENPQRRSRPLTEKRSPPCKLWRKPGEPPSPQLYSSIPRRANSRTRTPSLPS